MERKHMVKTRGWSFVETDNQTFSVRTIYKHSNSMKKWVFFVKRADHVTAEMCNYVKRKTCCHWGHVIANPPAHSGCCRPKHVLL